MDELSGHLTELGGAGGDGERNEVEGNDVELVSPCAGYVRWGGRGYIGMGGACWEQGTWGWGTWGAGQCKYLCLLT